MIDYESSTSSASLVCFLYLILAVRVIGTVIKIFLPKLLSSKKSHANAHGYVTALNMGVQTDYRLVANEYFALIFSFYNLAFFIIITIGFCLSATFYSSEAVM